MVTYVPMMSYMNLFYCHLLLVQIKVELEMSGSARFSAHPTVSARVGAQNLNYFGPGAGGFQHQNSELTRKTIKYKKTFIPVFR